MAESMVVNFKTSTLHADPPTCGVEVDGENTVRRTRKQIDSEKAAYGDLSKCKKCFD